MNVRSVAVLLIFFASGVAGLMYEVLWLKELKLLFGSTAQSVATVTAAFFLGIAAGSYAWGRRLREVSRPLRTYAWLELGILLAAGCFHAVLFVWDALYPALFAGLGDVPAALTLSKLLLSMFAILPAAFFMGGTLPVMGQYLIRTSDQLGRWSGWLYATNTFGAATGALLAGFFLPQAIGFGASYLCALGISLAVALIAFVLAAREQPYAPIEAVTAEREVPADATFRLLSSLAFLSGFATLALQVLWTRMFQQVLQNSVYTFSAILAVFLLSLALGAVLARLLTLRVPGTPNVLAALLVGSGLVVLTVPFAFVAWTDGLRYIATGAAFADYLGEILLAVSVLVGMPTCVLGMLLPYLYRFAEGSGMRPGVVIGRLNGANTLGAVAGSLIAGFVLLEWLGLWSGMRLIGFGYLLAAVVVLSREPGVGRPVMFYASVAVLLAPVSFLDPSRLDKVRIRPVERDEALVDLIEGSSGTVAVVRQGSNLRLKLDNWYALGGSGAASMEAMQTHLPLNLHPDPQKIFFLGLGTGITAGAAVQYPVHEITVAELVAEVIEASQRHFGAFTAGLHEDARVRVVNEDGRNYLRASREQFDVVIADLFIPWRSGVSSLYSVEHFRSALGRLATGGLYVQWVPLYQINEREFGILARSMAQTFPQVTAWRGDFEAVQPMLALVGHRDAGPLPPDAPLVDLSREAIARLRDGRGDDVPLLSHYLGRISADDRWVAESRLNTEDRPWIEFLAPESHREVRSGNKRWLVGNDLMVRLRGLVDRSGLQQDAYLSGLEPALKRAAYAGFFIHLAAVARENGDDDAASRATARASQLLRE